MHHQPVPVEHRWAGLDRRTIVPAAGVLCLAVLWSIVLPAIDGLIPLDREVDAGTVLSAGHDVTLVPPVGWNIESGLDARKGGAPDSPVAPEVELTSGGTTVEVLTVTWTDDINALLERVNEIQRDTREPGWEVTGAEGSVTTDAGATGIVENFVATSGPGQVFVFLEDEVGVQVLVESTYAELGARQPDINQMVASIDFTGGGSSG
jgi:hypothetical protein